MYRKRFYRQLFVREGCPVVHASHASNLVLPPVLFP